MPEPNPAPALSAEDLQAIAAAIALLREKLGPQSGLTPSQRQQLVKIGRKSQTFVQQSLAAAETHADLMPRFLDIEAARQNLELFESLHAIVQSLSQLHKLAEDTQMIAGSEAYAAARTAYTSLKANGKGMGLDDVIDNLSLRFQKTRREPVTQA